MKIGLDHLKDYITVRGDIIEPNVGTDDLLENYIMLYYYRNPLNYLFFNESIVLASMHSFGLQQEWKDGVEIEQLFKRCSFLS